jgi:hypothetical protein
MKALFLLMALLPATSFAFTENGRYRVDSAQSVVDVKGDKRCISILEANTFGAVGDVLEVSITNSVVIIDDPASHGVEAIQLSAGHHRDLPGLGGGDVISTDGNFEADRDVFTRTDEMTTSSEIITVSAYGDQLTFSVKRTNAPLETCQLTKVSQ